MSCFRVRYKKTGIPILDVLLPDGIPCNSFILLNGEPGTGKRIMTKELVYNRIKMEDPADLILYLTLEDSIVSKVQMFSSLDFDLKKILDKQKLCFIDGFSFRMSDMDKALKLRHASDEKLWNKLESCVVTVNPMDLRPMLNKITSLVSQHQEQYEDREEPPSGILIIDSMTELLTINKKDQVLEFMKALRARVCKENNVQILGINHVGVIEQFESVLSYFCDGIIDFRFAPALMKQGILMKEFRIRKMTGAKSINLWLKFFIEKGEGIKVPEKVIKNVGKKFEDLIESIDED